MFAKSTWNARYSLATLSLLALFCGALGAQAVAPAFGNRYPLEVFPTEAKRMVDDQTGAELLFLTSGPTKNQNLYFHQRSWLSDNSMILFASQRERGGLMGYLTATGELVRITAADGAPTGGATAAVNHPAVYTMAGPRVLEIAFEIEASKEPAKTPSKVWARQRLLCEMNGTIGQLNENCAGRFLATGGADPENAKSSAVFTISTDDGTVKRVCGMPPGTTLGVSHVQWSVTNPNWISFANAPIRLWVVDIRDGKPWAPYVERDGELVTHESWWVNDLMLFCGGTHAKPTEDSHVKTLDVRTGQVRIIGEGAWFPNLDNATISKRNWWHASGSADGRWAAGDNWHGDIMLFEGLTARPHLLTAGHRTYGSGAHPEVGWDRKGDQVIFGGSYKLGKGAHVCVATIPAAWQEEVRQLGRRIESVEKGMGNNTTSPTTPNVLKSE